MFNQFKIETVYLNVRNLENMTNFYEKAIGLSIIDRTDTSVSLGIAEDNTILVVLTKVDGPLHSQQEAGLYHTAFLLPKRSDLANYLIFASQHQIPLEGAADHGYSEALYLSDPEGNGIEIYVDKPASEWNILASGEIVGVTEPIDIEGLVETATAPTHKFPSQTFIGHVHLSVVDLAQGEAFLTKQLHMDVAYRFGQQALFFGVEGYHHQLAMNTWMRPSSPKDSHTTGLSSMVIKVSKDFMKQLPNHSTNQNSFSLVDSANQITYHLHS
ncbi:VOC family protein [Vagococcus zengguangii]|uniref:VOC family protein n=1 Tax=Vagococcus zengguangii TaxID=2571750 RepID=A0A4D7CXD8_9ENTE|nr:VOC family protein [Vagococcus zengguangii]QCI87101.1 VOC family protein [Vagococcus zengguangii]TLG80861.1 VOC family protein [Vagococcus zengguangii]